MLSTEATDIVTTYLPEYCMPRREECVFYTRYHSVYCGGCNKLSKLSRVHTHARRHHPSRGPFSSLQTLFEMMTLVVITSVYEKLAVPSQDPVYVIEPISYQSLGVSTSFKFRGIDEA